MITREDINLSGKKQQEGTDQESSKINPSNKASSSSIYNSITTTSWTKLKDPRIVRVSRAFGGKDRHSKVCTVRGLRDRRVRLSVSTAIQLYDLQDRLGLNQPSKVVDWLLDAAKDEIDELPPLQIPPGSLNPNFYPMLGVGAGTQINKESVKMHSGNNINWDVDLRSKSKEVVTDAQDQDQRETSSNHGHYHHQNNVLNINALPYDHTNFLKWDPSNLSLAHHGDGGSVSEQENIHNFNVMALPTLGSQVLVYPSQSFFQHGGSVSQVQENPWSTNSFRHNSIHDQDSTTQSHVRPFHFLPSQNSEGRE